MCEMCGSESTLFKTNIENTMMNVCDKCSKFGKVIAPVRAPVTKKTQQAPMPVQRELIQVVAEDYSERVKHAREKLGMKQIELAKKMAERESVIHKIESGQFEPSLNLARKLENHLRIKLVEQHEETKEKKTVSGAPALTIGDMLDIK